MLEARKRLTRRGDSAAFIHHSPLGPFPFRHFQSQTSRKNRAAELAGTRTGESAPRSNHGPLTRSAPCKRNAPSDQVTLTPPDPRAMTTGAGTQIVVRANSETPQSPSSVATNSKPL